MDALVPSDHLAARVTDVTGAIGGVELSIDASSSISVRHKAYLMAVGLISNDQSKLSRVLAHLRLAEVPHREHRMSQLVLGQREEEVRLILGAIDASPEPVPA